eukprot:5839621-Pyramimonas_sp.AAC.1
MAHYIDNVLERGAVTGIWGDPWALEPEEEGPPHLLLSWATLTGGIYGAHERDKDNVYVCHNLKKGLAR